MYSQNTIEEQKVSSNSRKFFFSFIHSICCVERRRQRVDQVSGELLGQKLTTTFVGIQFEEFSRSLQEGVWDLLQTTINTTFQSQIFRTVRQKIENLSLRFPNKSLSLSSAVREKLETYLKHFHIFIFLFVTVRANPEMLVSVASAIPLTFPPIPA